MTLIKSLVPIIEDIARWSLIIVIISFIISVISILLTVDLSQSSNSAIRIFSLTLSNYLFYLGSITLAIGLIIAFFKRPPSDKPQVSKESKFVPKYGVKSPKTSKIKAREVTKSPPLFSSRETKIIMSGISVTGLAILLWIVYLLLDFFSVLPN